MSLGAKTQLHTLLKQTAGIPVPPGLPDLAGAVTAATGSPGHGPYRIEFQTYLHSSGMHAWVLIERSPSDGPAATPHVRITLSSATPPEIAEGCALSSVKVDYELHPQGAWSAFGSARAIIQGKSFPLEMSLMAMEEGDLQLVFLYKPETLDILVSLGPFGALGLEQLEVLTSNLAGSFRLKGLACLELRGISGLGGRDTVLRGAFTLVPGGSLGSTFFRVDFEPAQVYVEILDGISCVLSPRHLYFSLCEDAPPGLEMTSGIFLSGLPSALAQLLPGETLAEINIGEEGLQIGARYLFEPVELALPPIEPLFGGPPTEMGSIVVSAEHLRLHLNRELALSVELGLGLPESINKLAPSPWFETLSPSHRAPNLRLRLSVRGSDAELQLLDSPLKMLKLTPQRGSVPNAVLHLGRYGDIQFTLPVFRFDFVSKTLRAEGVFEYKDLCIPLSPIHALLRAAGKAELAQQLPEMLSVQPLDFGGIMRLVAGIIQSAIAKGPVGDKVRELLEDLFKNAEHMPERLRASFLNISPPRELGYQLSFGLDFSAHLSLFVSPAAPAPFRILLPLMGHRGPELIGITLYRLALGEILGGQLATLELDAEFERFEFLPIALSAGLSACGLFPPTSALEQRIVCRDLFAVMGNPGGIPIVMPLFFKHLGFCYTGLDGLSAEICLRFPRPELEFFTLARALRTIHGLGDIMAKRNGQGKTILEFPAELQTGLSVGPCYVRFPNYIGAQRLGTDTPIRIGDGTRLVSELTSILHTLDVDTLFAHLRSIDTLVQEEIELELGPALQQALRAWSDVVGPVILFVSGTPLYNSHNEVTEKPAGFSARIGMLRGRIAQGVKALRGHGEPLRVRARVVDISPEALHLIAVYSPAPKEPSREIPLTLRWERWLESAAELEDIVSAAPA